MVRIQLVSIEENASVVNNYKSYNQRKQEIKAARCVQCMGMYAQMATIGVVLPHVDIPYFGENMIGEDSTTKLFE